ncbi:MAG: DUF58 domain-containing protein [Desulfobacterales bacterium]|nr:DUF58 domain-containing protein [Desulfobacterales bacterium]MBF0397632.1 DUF58 domain-containing protein [Desulfobacterales bacterium]
MLSPELIKKIRKIHIKCGRLVNSVMAGQYKSIFRGSGIEFEEVREYIPGDEVKSIDWKVSARMGRPYVKLYREERELIVMLLLDMSASTQFGTCDSIKKETAAETAAIIAFNAIRNNDKVGAILFTDRVEKYIPPKKGSSHVWRVIKEIFEFKPEHKKTNVQNALFYLSKVARKKTVSFIISDFITNENYEKELKITSKKHKLFAVILSDPKEFALPKSGIILIEDLETGELLELYRDNEEYNQLSFHENTIKTLKKASVESKKISTSDSVANELTKYFRYLEKRKR